MTALRAALTHTIWPWIAMGVSAAMLAAAHAFEVFGQMYPCPLCLRQREVYWALIAMGVTGLILWRIKPTARFLAALNVLMGMVFVTGAIVAGYHAGVEWGIFPPPAACAAGADVDPLAPIDFSGPMAVPACTDAPGYILGLSMAGWNAVASLGFAGLSFVAAARRPVRA